MTDHPHRWIIATPNGPTSPGRCRTCGEIRHFPNSDPNDREWDDVPATRGGARLRQRSKEARDRARPKGGTFA